MTNTPSQTHVEVRVFGSASSKLGSSSITVAVSSQATAADLLEAIAVQHPSVGDEVAVGRIAIDHEFAPNTSPITTAQELALISMVSGG